MTPSTSRPTALAGVSALTGWIVSTSVLKVASAGTLNV
jgi:hypothetical protein